MTEMFINSDVISKDIVKCVSRIDCSSVSKVMIEPAKFIVPKPKEETMWNKIDELKELEMVNQLKQIQEEEEEAAMLLLSFK